MVRREALPYRPCVGLFLVSAAGLVFVGERRDTPGAWQMPQGGIDAGETPLEAGLRELEEEIGTANARLIGETARWLDYDLPDHLLGKVWNGRFRGQRTKWLALRFTGTDDEINVAEVKHPEFDRWQWLEVARLPEVIVPFKRDVYERVVAELGHLAVPARD